MKAQHRKELQTNVLADQMGHLLEAAKAGPSHSTMVVGGIILLVIVLYAGWKFYSQHALTKQSELWLKLDEAANVDSLQTLETQHPGTLPGRVAKLEQARINYRDGMKSLFSTLEASEARDKVQKAKDLYEALARESLDSPVLVQEALMGAAKASETLGDIEGAVHYYEKLVKDYPKSALGKEADERLTRIKENPEQFKDLYTRLQNIAESRKKESSTPAP